MSEQVKPIFYMMCQNLPLMDGKELSVLLLPNGEKKDRKDCCTLRLTRIQVVHTDGLLQTMDVLRSLH